MYRRLRLTLCGVAIAAGLVAAIPSFATGATVTPTGRCSVSYQPTDYYTDSYQVGVSISNLGEAAWASWTLAFDLAASQRVRYAWNARWSQSGAAVTFRNTTWNGRVVAGGSVRLSFLAAPPATTVPSTFTVNGIRCDLPTSPTPTSPSPVPTSPAPTSPSQPPTTGPSQPPVHADNPYAGADGYVNPDWAAQVRTAASAAGGDLGAAMSTVAGQSTAVWLDSIAAITAGRGLRGHLDAAVEQQRRTGRQVVVTLVLYNLPNRSCPRTGYLGELAVAEDGLSRYRTGYIDPIAAILADPAYAGLRIATVVEPDSLPWVILETALYARTARCTEVRSSGVYVEGIRYALSALHAIGNVYTYLDIANVAVFGWDDVLGRAADIYAQVVAATPGGLASVDGFATNTANYVPVKEPYFTITATVNGTPVRQSRWLDWSNYPDEGSYAEAMYQALVARGFPGGTGMVIDTSRNGWGGPNRPAGASTATDVSVFVNASRVDRRAQREDWCNQVGAGLGARPQASPAPHLDAYLWVKPPGESDGRYGASTGASPREAPDTWCDPAWMALDASFIATNALSDSPPAGTWFPAFFEQLVRNAYPPV